MNISEVLNYPHLFETDNGANSIEDSNSIIEDIVELIYPMLTGRPIYLGVPPNKLNN